MNRLRENPRAAASVLAAFWAAAVLLNIRRLSAGHQLEIKAAQAVLAPLELMVRAPGVLEPEKNAAIKAEFDGPVVRKSYREGELVQEGQVLLEIGRDNLKLQHAARENEVTNSRIELERAKKEVRLQETLLKEGAVAATAVEDAQRALLRARQNLDMTAATFAAEQERWNRNILKAPFTGTVIKDSLGAEQAVASGKEVLRIGDLNSYAMQVQVDELEIGRVKEGQSAWVRLQAYEGARLSASVTKIGTQGEDRGGVLFPVTLKIIPVGGMPLLPQFTGESRIRVGQTEPVVSVPLTALTTLEDKRFVWEITGSRRLKARAVEVGRSNADRVEITKGLAAGRKICMSADSRFRDGMKVIVHE